MDAYRTDDYQSKLQFQSNDFYLLGSTWQLKGKIQLLIKSSILLIKGKITSVENHPSRPTNESDRSIHLELVLRDPDQGEKKEIEYLILKSPKVSLI